MKGDHTMVLSSFRKRWSFRNCSIFFHQLCACKNACPTIFFSTQDNCHFQDFNQKFLTNKTNSWIEYRKVSFRSRCRLLQIAYEVDFWSLCTVTFWQKVDFLISNTCYNWRLYGSFWSCSYSKLCIVLSYLNTIFISFKQKSAEVSFKISCKEMTKREAKKCNALFQ